LFNQDSQHASVLCCAVLRAATGNTSPYIWASWGYLESMTGNVSRARKLFDAAIVVDETHAAAWHKWGMLEMRQGTTCGPGVYCQQKCPETL
jgi:hypothetical protein